MSLSCANLVRLVAEALSCSTTRVGVATGVCNVLLAALLGAGGFNVLLAALLCAAGSDALGEGI